MHRAALTLEWDGGWECVFNMRESTFKEDLWNDGKWEHAIPSYGKHISKKKEESLGATLCMRRFLSHCFSSFCWLHIKQIQLNFPFLKWHPNLINLCVSLELMKNIIIHYCLHCLVLGNKSNCKSYLLPVILRKQKTEKGEQLLYWWRGKYSKTCHVIEERIWDRDSEAEPAAMQSLLSAWALMNQQKSSTSSGGICATSSDHAEIDI